MVSNSNNTVTNLLTLANEILADSAGPDSIVLNLERYVTDFQKWWEEFDSGRIEVEQSLLEKLSERHEKVLDLARDLQSQTGQVLQDTRRKSKGMIAYVDCLPKRISTRRVKKG